MKLKLVKYHPLFAYSVGDVFEVNEADTKHLLDGKYAEPLGEAAKEEKKEEPRQEPEAENASDQNAGAALEQAKANDKKSNRNSKKDK
jgi:hypothetical protein